MLIQWFDSRATFADAVQRLRPMATVVERRLARGTGGLDGYCCICRQVVQFTVVRSPEPGWTDLREAIACPHCRTNGRMRLIVTAIRLAERLATGRFGILERITPLFSHLQAEYPNVRGYEFLEPSLPSGSCRDVHGVQVEHQDFMQLSIGDASLDLLVHGDVLEHVPDHRRALEEAARVLKPGGQMIFTCPFYDSMDEHIVRCRMENGQLVHLLPPAFHGNPLSADGSLVFIHPGWALFDDVRDAGFSTTEIGICYDPYQGIVSNNNPFPDGHMWPVIFRAVR